MTPAGIAIVIGFAVILAIAFWMDHQTNVKFKAEFEKNYTSKAVEFLDKDFVTNDGSLLLYTPNGALTGYKVYQLDDIKYFDIDFQDKFTTYITFYDAKHNAMKGEYITPSKKKKIIQNRVVLNYPEKKARDLIHFVIKHNPQMQESNQ